MEIFHKINAFVEQWITSKSFSDERNDVAWQLHTLGPTYLVQFVYFLDNAWTKGGFNHELDELCVLLENHKGGGKILPNLAKK
jgi:hypothetical protein